MGRRRQNDGAPPGGTCHADAAVRDSLYTRALELVELASHQDLVEQGARYAALWASWQTGIRAA